MPDPASLNLATQVTGHQRFFLDPSPRNRVDRELIAAIDKLGDGMENLHFVSRTPLRIGPPARLFPVPAGRSSAQSRARSASSLVASIAVPGASRSLATEQSFLHFETQLRMLIEHRQGSVTTLAGVQRPRSYTSQAMTQFAYAGALQPAPGKQFPLGGGHAVEQDRRNGGPWIGCAGRASSCRATIQKAR